MRTKAILLGAALLAAGVASSMAQSNVYSLNVVGYVTITVPPNAFVFTCNPLLGASNDYNSLFASCPNNTTKVFEWDPVGVGFNIYTKRSTGFSSYDGHPVPPGMAFFLQNTAATPITNTFVGTVLQGTNGVPYVGANGYSAISSPAPLSGGVETALGFPAVNNDKLYQWDVAGQGYTIITRHPAAWGSPGEPQIGVSANLGPAEGFFMQSVAGGTWNQVFTVQ